MVLACLILSQCGLSHFWRRKKKEKKSYLVQVSREQHSLHLNK